MAEPPGTQGQERSYSRNIASDHARQQNGDQHHRYEGVGAVYHGDIQRVATPIGRGSILSPTRWITTRENGEALIDAARQGQIERMRRILASKYTDVDFMDRQKNTALLAAIQGKQLAAVALLLNEGANPGRRYSSAQETPLILAAKLECDDIIAALLQHNAAVDDVQTIRKSAVNVQHSLTSIISPRLIDAASQGQIDRINELLSRPYVDVNFIDDQGMTALLAAVENRESAAATLLLERGALPGLRHDERCKTPLMLAAWNGGVKIFRTLVEHDAPLCEFVIGEKEASDLWRYDQDVKMGGPISIMRTAIFRGDPTIVFELLQHGILMQKAALSSALRELCEENVEVIQRLIDAGADVEARDGFGKRPLHYAAALGYTKTIEILYAAGADIEAREYSGHTVLHVAASRGKVEAVQRLIALGANIEARDENDCTPLHVAAWRHRFDAIQILLDSGSDAFAVDKDGKTPYDIACQAPSWDREMQRKVIDLFRSHMEIDDDGAEVKSFVTARSRPDGGIDMNGSDIASEGSTPRQSIDLDASRPSVEE